MLTITGTMDKAKLKETGIDLLAESLVGEKSADPEQQAASMKRVRQMINGMAMMLGVSDISGEIKAYEKTRSILGTVQDLYDSGNIAVAFMVGLFSVVIPTIKILMMLAMTMIRDLVRKQTLIKVNSAMSKWSMADVFVIALIVTYMAANASSNTGLLEFQSSFESGFYYFLTYCVFSIAASQLLQVANRPDENTIEEQPTQYIKQSS